MMKKLIKTGNEGVIRAISVDKYNGRLFVSCFNLGNVTVFETGVPLKMVSKAI